MSVPADPVSEAIICGDLEKLRRVCSWSKQLVGKRYFNREKRCENEAAFQRRFGLFFVGGEEPPSKTLDEIRHCEKCGG